MIKIERIYAVNDEELQDSLNALGGRIVSVEPLHDNIYKVICEIS